MLFRQPTGKEFAVNQGGKKESGGLVATLHRKKTNQGAHRGKHGKVWGAKNG